MSELTLTKLRSTRDLVDLVPKTFSMHPDMAKAFRRQANREGSTQIALLERVLVYYFDTDGESARVK